MRSLYYVAIFVLSSVVAGCFDDTSTTRKDSDTPPATGAPTVTLGVTSDSVEYGDRVTMDWSSTNATTCTASGAWSGAKSTRGSETSQALVEDSDFVLECSGNGGKQSAARKVGVKIPVPTATLTATPATVGYGETTNLSWSTKHVKDCLASGAWSGVVATSGNQASAALTANSTFTLTCTGVGGSISTSADVAVTPPAQAPAAPMVNLSASATSIAYDGSTTLSWSSSNATSCTASGGWSGAKATSGTQTLSNRTATATYTLSCTGAGGTTAQEVTVNVAPPPPTLNFGASATSIAYNGSSTLTWSSTGATSCTATGSWNGARGTSGNQALSGLTSTSTYTLSCTGGGGTVSRDVTITVAPPVTPTLSFSASSTSVAYNGSSTLTWSSTGANSCAATGGWSGTKATSGNQVLSNLTATATYSLSCTGTGGTASGDVTISVAPPAAPTVMLSANPTQVAYNGSSTLTWSSTNASSCTASGGWTGPRATSNTETLNGLTATATYTLTCNGTGGSAAQSVTVTVSSGTAGTITGAVDSSRINRNGVNKVYLFSGSVTPDDDDGSGDAVASATVSQDENACTFSYAFTNVVPGTYTLAFTNQAANDVPGQNDTITFVGTTGVTVASSAVAQNFAAARVLTVGPGKTYARPSLAAAAAQAGDVIEIDAVEYVDDPMTWRDNNLTLRGVGGRAHIRGTQLIPYVAGDDARNGMGLWVIRSSNVVVENIEFSGARVPDENGAGIRAEGNGLTICNAYFHDNENGILGGVGELLIEYSEFNHNGIGEYGRTHNLYINEATTRLVFRHNYSHNAYIGHELKSRAQSNYILYNRLMNETGNASYEMDFPNGGLTYVIGNVVQQGPNTDNSTILAYGLEGLSGGRTHNLYVVNNTMVNDLGSGAFVTAASGTSVVQLINNLLVGGGADVSGPAAGSITRITNLSTSNPAFVNRAGYDYRLLGSFTAAINQGSNPGTLNGYDARPAFQYVHPAKRTARPSSGAYDIGAFEYVP
jgi:hypothetical protein